MKRVFIACCLLVQGIASISLADDMPARAGSGRYNQTLAGMPIPVVVTGTLKGIIQTTDGKPLAGGNMYFFNDATGPSPDPEKYWRVPDGFTSLDKNGGFSMELTPGTYYIGAILRNGEEGIIGPPSEGDISYAGKEKNEVVATAMRNLGVIKGAKIFSKDILAKREDLTAIEGLVFDKEGNPVENVMVFAHKNTAMNDKPLFVSDRTDKDGAYRLRVAGAGTFYLRVRNIYGGGVPVTGTIMGAYGGNSPKAVMVKDREVLRGINLTGEKFLRPVSKPKELPFKPMQLRTAP